MPNNAGELTQAEFDQRAAAAMTNTNNAGQETEVQVEQDNTPIENPVQKQPQS